MDRREEREARHSQGLVCIIAASSKTREHARAALSEFGYKVRLHNETAGFLKDLKRNSLPSLVIYGLERGGEGVFSPLRELILRLQTVPVVVVSDDPTPDVIIKAVKLGAADYLVFPFNDGELGRALARILARRPVRRVRGGRNEPPAFLCSSSKMMELEETAKKVADSDVTVLIRGESGSGKEVLARHLHHLSSRADRPFIKVNCAALPEQLLESELFGHERGAFTGAVSQTIGRFEAADGGTIFLDEISEMSEMLQAKLLHVLQDRRFSRLGGNNEIWVDVRVLAASNRNLEHEMKEGRFRQDLYFRLKVIELHIPPLRERPEEIPLFLDHFITRFAKQYRRPVPYPSKELQNLFHDYAWTGNVRELENMVKRLIILGDETSVMREILSRTNPEDRFAAETRSNAQPGEGLKEVSRRAALVAERSAILSALEKTHWNRVKASKLLKVSYKTLLSKMKECGLDEA